MYQLKKGLGRGWKGRAGVGWRWTWGAAAVCCPRMRWNAVRSGVGLGREGSLLSVSLDGCRAAWLPGGRCTFEWGVVAPACARRYPPVGPLLHEWRWGAGGALAMGGDVGAARVAGAEGGKEGRKVGDEGDGHDAHIGSRLLSLGGGAASRGAAFSDPTPRTCSGGMPGGTLMGDAGGRRWRPLRRTRRGGCLQRWASHLAARRPAWPHAPPRRLVLVSRARPRVVVFSFFLMGPFPSIYWDMVWRGGVAPPWWPPPPVAACRGGT